MTLATHPLLAGFREAFRAGPADETDVRVCVDFLQEQGAALADVLLLYAGTPPDWLAPAWHEDEGLRAVLATWCQWTEPERLVLAPATICRFEMVRASWLDERERLDAEIEDAMLGSNSHVFRRLRRDQKRRVLSLFPDVRALRPQLLAGYPIFVDGTQQMEKVAAPDWIAPEPPHRGTRADVMVPFLAAPTVGFLIRVPPAE